jgi:hypothetical protein
MLYFGQVGWKRKCWFWNPLSNLNFDYIVPLTNDGWMEVNLMVGNLQIKELRDFTNDFLILQSIVQHWWVNTKIYSFITDQLLKIMTP